MNSLYSPQVCPSELANCIEPYHGDPWCWLQHIIYICVVSTLIQSLWSTVGFCVHQSIVELHPIWSHYFECLSFLLCVLHCIVELCADSAVQCVRMCGRRRREELQKVDATLYYIKSGGLTHLNFLAGQKLNLQGSMSSTLDLHQEQRQ